LKVDRLTEILETTQAFDHMTLGDVGNLIESVAKINVTADELREAGRILSAWSRISNVRDCPSCGVERAMYIRRDPDDPEGASYWLCGDCSYSIYNDESVSDIINKSLHRAIENPDSVEVPKMAKLGKIRRARKDRMAAAREAMNRRRPTV
jgi:hypothetical protein